MIHAEYGYRLFFDGGFTPVAAGFGWHVDVFRDMIWTTIAYGYGPLKVQSSLEAEFMALSEGIIAIKNSQLANRQYNFKQLLIYGDSRSVCDAVSYTPSKPIWQPVRDLIRHNLNAMNINWDIFWVKRRQNSKADALSGQGMRLKSATRELHWSGII